MSDKRILIISNEALNSSNSNGRTLLNLLKCFKPQDIAQFSLHEDIDTNVCKNSYQVTDKDALNAFLGKKKREKTTNKKAEKGFADGKKFERSCRNLVLRDLIWKSYRWWKKDFDEFIQNFKPDVILFQAGDSPFMYDITRKIAKKYKLPVIMYNSENYVLKKYMYSGVKKFNLWHSLLKNSLIKQYKKMMKSVSYCVYITEYLESLYQQAYPHKDKSIALYTATEMKDLNNGVKNDNFTLLYCGNLGVGRAQPLKEIAKTLYSINPNYKMIVCGKFYDEQSKPLIIDNPNVEYLGLVSYSEVAEKMSKASMVIHAENIERLEGLKGAFSTKIADCLACGKPFLVYATSEYPFVKYLLENKVAHVAENLQELKEILTKCAQDEEYLNMFVSNAKELAFRNHNAKENSEKMYKIIKEVLDKNV